MSNSVPDFFNLSYLKSGTPRQQMVYQAIEKSRVMERLAPFDPVLVGTFPLEVDIETSDIDILCEFSGAPHLFAEILSTTFDEIVDFVMTERKIKEGVETVICRFSAFDFEFEIFAQPKPVREQNGYLHMIAEWRLLELESSGDAGKSVREEIRKLKRSGLKTEPAFARHFGIDGDPYERLKELAMLSESELRRFGKPIW